MSDRKYIGLPSSMKDELDDHQEDYLSLTHEDWCELLSTTEVKYERKIEATQIKKAASAREEYLSDSNESVRIPRKNKASTGVLRSNKSPQKKAHKHHGTHTYCVFYKKAGMSDRKYMSHSAEDCTDQSTNRTTKEGMGGSVGSRADTVKQ